MEIVNLPGPYSPDTAYRFLADSALPVEACFGRMMLDFLNSLRRDVIGPRLFVRTHLIRELRLRYSAPNGTSATITVTVDHPDHGPLEDGLPLLHYRLSYKIRSWNEAIDGPPIEERTRSVETACGFVREAIREARRDGTDV